MDRLLRHKLRD